MSPWLASYLERTRNPWACVVFVVPLLIAYEVGLRSLNANPDELRTGADAQLQRFFYAAGVEGGWVQPAVVAFGLFAWGWLADRRPWEDPLGTWSGMVLESVLFAGVLFGVVQASFPALAHSGGVVQNVLGNYLEISPGNSPETTWAMILRFVGAGIYEETIFRLIGFSLLRLLFLIGDLRPRRATILAAGVSAVLFAAAHHMGGGSEHINATVFLYRMLAGLYFTAVFQTRGFGIAVGAHAGYDVLVGLILR
ncbi:MAG: CPBP family intramembrane glutamic endopeptidase [Planctomycetota bacterium]